MSGRRSPVVPDAGLAPNTAAREAVTGPDGHRRPGPAADAVGQPPGEGVHGADKTLVDEVGEDVRGYRVRPRTRHQGFHRGEVVGIVDDEARQVTRPAVPDLQEARTVPVDALAQ